MMGYIGELDARLKVCTPMLWFPTAQQALVCRNNAPYTPILVALDEFVGSQ